jgi:dTDP-4-dehydrorhamnose reductase
MKRILITGSNGLLGQKIASILASETDFDVLLTSIERQNQLANLKFNYSQLDITQKSDVKSLIHNYKPDFIVNTAALTNVDECENDREYAWRLNVDAVKNLIIAARIIDSKIIHFSTDYVFNGKSGPYFEDSPPNPINYYGRTKLASENALKISGVNNCIIRTMILYGFGKQVKSNFVLWIINQLQNNQVIKIVEDQFGNPTLIDDLAIYVLKIIETNKSGLYHICGSENLNRYKFALKIAQVFKLNENLIKPVKTEDLGQTAPRPLKSGLNCFKATSEIGIKLLNVEHGLFVLKRQLELENFKVFNNIKGF